LRVRINVTGIVQGVGFRPFVYRLAVKHGLLGYVRNMGDAGVEILLEGEEEKIKIFLNELKENRPLQAQIHDIVASNLTGKNVAAQFTILRSSAETEHSGSVVPPDIAICQDCLREFRDPKDPRFDYFFITCVNCGPRFTIIERLPYDRENTTMREFPLCGFCQKEYNDPSNRRFHAQTVACPSCGPKAYLTTESGEVVNSNDPVREAGKLISEGKIVAMKGYGGFHIATSAIKEAPLNRLRESKQRRAKPFALMARNLNEINSFAEVNSKEEELLTSSVRPIVLLDKSDQYCLSESIAPGLHNIGVMLPYSAMHCMLFDQIDDAVFVMTSANQSNQPMVKDNAEALKTLSGTVDYFLFHNRQIAHRCDDSVMRVHESSPVFVRRSRGYAPAPVMLRTKSRQCVVALGGELNNTSCILNEEKAFLSQHIGDVENLETRDFLQEATEHIISLTNTHIETIACDLHPKFTTTNLAKELAEHNKWRIIQVQHHHAHAAALMAEHNENDIIGIVCDGYGYGTDGSAWGGEVLHCTRGATDFKRLGHLESQPLLGGDTATKYPLRIAAGILNKKLNADQWVLENSSRLPHGEIEANLILTQLKKAQRMPESTSLGRLFDAAAAITGVCYERTYEGEAAMKLESAAVNGKDVLELQPIISNDILNTTEMLVSIFENRKKISRENLAYSIHEYIAKGLATLAIEKAVNCGVGTVGFTGGSAVNSLLSKLIRRIIENNGLHFITHESIPAGDGGISLGQAVVGSF
jgi:hydrogenase maturation protein HypF